MAQNKKTTSDKTALAGNKKSSNKKSSEIMGFDKRAFCTIVGIGLVFLIIGIFVIFKPSGMDEDTLSGTDEFGNPFNDNDVTENGTQDGIKILYGSDLMPNEDYIDEITPAADSDIDFSANSANKEVVSSDTNKLGEEKHTWVGAYISNKSISKHVYIIVTWNPLYIDPVEHICMFLSEGESAFYSPADIDTQRGVATFSIPQLNIGTYSVGFALDKGSEYSSYASCYVLKEDDYKNFLNHWEEQYDANKTDSLFEDTPADEELPSLELDEYIKENLKPTIEGFKVIETNITRSQYKHLISAQARQNNEVGYQN